MFKIDSVFIRLDGNYLEIDTSNLERVFKTKTVIRAKKKNLDIVINERWIRVIGSASTFLNIPVNHSNFDIFINSLNDVFNINEFQFAKITRFDVCIDIDTTKTIETLQHTLGGLARFKREKFKNSIYYQTTDKKYSGTKLVIYQKKSGLIRFELRAFKNSKYCIKRISEVKKLFVRNCHALVTYYDKIQKLDAFELEKIRGVKDLEKTLIRTIYNTSGVSGIEQIINLIDNKKNGHRIKNKILRALDSPKNTVGIDLKLKKSLDKIDKICV